MWESWWVQQSLAVSSFGVKNAEILIREMWDMISLSLCGAYVVPLILYWMNPSWIHVKIFIGIFLTGFINEFLKHVVFDDPRPATATNCNLCVNDGPQGGKPGMPSGHSATATFFAACYFTQTQNPWIRAGLVGYAILVMISRYQKRCHTLPQITAGSLLGLLLSQCVNYRA